MPEKRNPIFNAFPQKLVKGVNQVKVLTKGFILHARPDVEEKCVVEVGCAPHR
jgi:hypothetical protein